LASKKSAYSRPALTVGILAALIVTVGSLGPFRFRDTYGRFLRRQFHLFGAAYVTPHALLHFVSFGLLGFVAALISARWLIRAIAIAGVLLLGLAIEWFQHQAHASSRFETWDLVSDTWSCCAGAFAACMWSTLAARRSERPRYKIRFLASF